MTKKVVFTDFDGTYIKGDSYFLSLIFFGGWQNFLRNSFKLLLIVIEYYFNFITRNEAKRRTYKLIYTNMCIDDINRKLNSFHRRLHVFPKVKKKLSALKKSGFKIVLVTASLDIYMVFLSKKFGFDDCLCTETEKNGNFLTGRLKRKNCNYSEKVVRIKESKYYDTEAEIIAIGNSKGDKEMLEIAKDFYTVDKKGDITRGVMPW